jgi:phosphatidylinositol-3-phosphatase
MNPSSTRSRNPIVLDPLEPRCHLTAAAPRPDHVVVVVEENHSYDQVVGSRSAPFINGLARAGALFTNSHGVTHPSQPNYLALFAGSTFGVNGNDCVSPRLNAPNLYTSLKSAGHTFASYSEGLPKTGSTACSAGAYERKHNPAAVFANVPPAANRRIADFPTDFDDLPDVAMVVPDQDHDMHDGSVAAGDAWLKGRLARYAKWAMKHNSLLIVTFDEGDGGSDNRVATIAYGPMVRPGRYVQRINHYNVLRTLEDMFDAPRVGKTAHAFPIKAWKDPMQG